MAAYGYSKKKIQIADIVFVPEFYPRDQIDPNRVDHLRSLLDNRVFLPPIKVVWDSIGKHYVEIDGWHRTKARQQLGETEIEAYVLLIPREHWFLEAYIVNNQGAKQLTESEHKNGLIHMWESGLTTAVIADRTGFTEQYINRIVKPVRDEKKARREKMIEELKEKGCSVRDIATKVGLSPGRVAQMSGRKKEEGTCDEKEVFRKEPCFFSKHPNDPVALCAKSPALKTAVADDQQPASEDYTDDDLTHVLGLDLEKDRSRTELHSPVAIGGDTPDSDDLFDREERKARLEAENPTYAYQVIGYDTFAEKDRKAVRIMELVKLYDRDVADIEIIVEEPGDWIRGIAVAAIILAISEAGDRQTVEVAERIGLPYNLADTIAEFNCYKAMFRLVGPHLSEWVDRNLPEEFVSVILNLLDMGRSEFLVRLSDRPVSVPDAPDLPQKHCHTINNSISGLRMLRDDLKLTVYSDHSIAVLKKDLAKLKSTFNEVYQMLRIPSEERCP